MANNSRINPMLADTASDARLVSDTSDIIINAINLKASDATWACILKDGAGNVIFDANNVGNPHGLFFPFPKGFRTTGLVVNTLTACIAYIYTKQS